MQYFTQEELRKQIEDRKKDYDIWVSCHYLGLAHRSVSAGLRTECLRRARRAAADVQRLSTFLEKTDG